jgi:hypothetical protein
VTSGRIDVLKAAPPGGFFIDEGLDFPVLIKSKILS